jgi:hypothetical protein
MNLSLISQDLGRPAEKEAGRPGNRASPTGPRHSRDGPHLIGSSTASMR